MKLQLLIALCTVSLARCTWENDYDEYFKYECPLGRFINYFESHHDNVKEDRIFDFEVTFINTKWKM